MKILLFLWLLLASLAAAGSKSLYTTEYIEPGSYDIYFHEDISIKDREEHMSWVKREIADDNRIREELYGDQKYGVWFEGDVYYMAHLSNHLAKEVNKNSMVDIMEPTVLGEDTVKGNGEVGDYKYDPSVFERAVSEEEEEEEEDSHQERQIIQTEKQSGARWNLAAISHKRIIPRSRHGLRNDRFEYLYEPSQGNPTYAYVLDTGIDLSHPEFEGRAQFGVDITEGRKGKSDKKHGTHVASIIGGATFGVAKNVTLTDVTLNGYKDVSYAFWMAEGLTWAVNDRLKNGRARQSVINISAGIWRPGFDPDHAEKRTVDLIEEAMKLAEQHEIHVIVSGGNQDVADVVERYPTSIKYATTVGATDEGYDKSWFSNSGSSMDIWAPGVNINGAIPGEKYEQMSGTSQAAPHVAGVIAYLLDVEGLRSQKDMWKRLKKLSVDQDTDHLFGAPDRFLFNGNKEAEAEYR